MTTMTDRRIQIIFAPLPDDPTPAEESAASEFAKRAKRLFQEASSCCTSPTNNNNIAVDINCLAGVNSEAALSSNTSLLLLIISAQVHQGA